MRISKRYFKGYCSLIPLFVFLLLFTYTFFWWETYTLNPNHRYFLEDHTGFWRTRDIPCLDLVLTGELYQGQLACAQGPVTYIAGGLLKLLFGNSIFSVGVLFALSAIAFCLFLLLFSLSNNSFLMIPAFFFVILPFVYTDFSTSLSTLFFLTTLYFLHTSSRNTLYFLAGICAALSLFTKSTLLLLFLALVFSSLITYYQTPTQKRRLFLTRAYFFIAGFILISAPALFFYPNSITYSFLSHFSDNPASLPQLFHEFSKNLFLGGEALHTLFILLILLLFFILTKNRSTLFPVFIFMGALIPMQILVAAVDNGGHTIGFQLFDYHLFPYILVFIGGCFILSHQHPTRALSHALFLAFIWLTFFAPQSSNAYYFFDTKINSPQEITLFDEFLNTFDYSHALVDIGLAERINTPILRTNHYHTIKNPSDWGIADSNYGTGIKKHGLYNESKNTVIFNFDKGRYTKILLDLYAELVQKNFRMIAMGPYHQSPLYFIIFQSSQITGIEPFPQKYVLYTPIILGQDFGTATFVFFTQDEYEQARQHMNNFFSLNLPKLCSTEGQTLTQYTLQTLALNNITSQFQCDMPDKHSSLLTNRNAIAFLFLFSYATTLFFVARM